MPILRTQSQGLLCVIPGSETNSPVVSCLVHHPSLGYLRAESFAFYVLYSSTKDLQNSYLSYMLYTPSCTSYLSILADLFLNSSHFKWKYIMSCQFFVIFCFLFRTRINKEKAKCLRACISATSGVQHWKASTTHCSENTRQTAYLVSRIGGIWTLMPVPLCFLLAWFTVP